MQTQNSQTQAHAKCYMLCIYVVCARRMRDVLKLWQPKFSPGSFQNYSGKRTQNHNIVLDIAYLLFESSSIFSFTPGCTVMP